MNELKEFEQYFFDKSTIDDLTNFIIQYRYKNVCCLCTPSLGEYLVENNIKPTILDIDERFKNVPGFKKFDINAPVWIDKKFDLIICDPPFFNLSLKTLVSTIKRLSRFITYGSNYSPTLIISYLKRREDAFLRAFHVFQLAPTRYKPKYKTLKICNRNNIEFYGNLSFRDLPRQISNIKEDVCYLVKGCLELNCEIRDKDSLIDDLGFDERRLMDLIDDLDLYFNFDTSPDDEVFNDVSTIGELVELVYDKLTKKHKEDKIINAYGSLK